MGGPKAAIQCYLLDTTTISWHYYYYYFLFSMHRNKKDKIQNKYQNQDSHYLMKEKKLDLGGVQGKFKV